MESGERKFVTYMNNSVHKKVHCLRSSTCGSGGRYKGLGIHLGFEEIKDEAGGRIWGRRSCRSLLGGQDFPQIKTTLAWLPNSLSKSRQPRRPASPQSPYARLDCSVSLSSSCISMHPVQNGRKSGKQQWAWKVKNKYSYVTIRTIPPQLPEIWRHRHTIRTVLDRLILSSSYPGPFPWMQPCVSK